MTEPPVGHIINLAKGFKEIPRKEAALKGKDTQSEWSSLEESFKKLFPAVINILIRWWMTPVGRVRRQRHRTIWEEIGSLGASDWNFVYMAYEVAVTEEKIKRIDLMRRNRDVARFRYEDVVEDTRKQLKNMEQVWDLLDRERLSHAMGNMITQRFKTLRAYEDKHERVAYELKIPPDHTNVPKRFHKLLAQFLCGHFEAITGNPRYAVVGRMLVVAGLLNEEGIPEEKRYRAIGERIRKMVGA